VLFYAHTLERHNHARCLFNGPNMLKKFDVDWQYSISSFLYSAILASKWPVQAPKSFFVGTYGGFLFFASLPQTAHPYANPHRMSHFLVKIGR